MYLQLVARSMDKRCASGVHPAFAEIVRQLQPSEAINLGEILNIGSLPIVKITLKLEPGFAAKHITFADHVVPWVDNNQDVAEEPLLPTWIANYQRLGLVEVDYVHSFSDSAMYEYVRSRPEYSRAESAASRMGESCSVAPVRGILKPTSFGVAFGEAIGIVDRDRANTIRTSIGVPVMAAG